MNPFPIEIQVDTGNALRGQRWPGGQHAILLVHAPGVNRDLDRWRPLIPYLLGQDLSVVTFDLRRHGGSDGDWSETAASTDILAAIVSTRSQGFTSLLVCAEGESAIAALRAAEQVKVEGVIAISPANVPSNPPRGAGESKLLVSAAEDREAKDGSATLLRASIGQALAISVPGNDRGTDLLTGEVALICREHIIAFIRKQTFGEPIGSRLSGNAADRFLDALGIHKGGTRE